MDIEKVSISLPERHLDWIEQQVRSGEYANRSEYIRELIRRDRRAFEVETLRAKLLEAQASADAGHGKRIDEAWFQKQFARLDAIERGNLAEGA
jgi:antitoxin ParD1/3/4